MPTSQKVIRTFTCSGCKDQWSWEATEAKTPTRDYVPSHFNMKSDTGFSHGTIELCSTCRDTVLNFINQQIPKARAKREWKP